MATLWQDGRRYDRQRKVTGRPRTVSPGASASLLSPKRRSFGWWQAVLTALPFAGLWWLLAGGNESWLIGAPCVLLAAAMAGLTDQDASSVRLSLLPGFFLWFVVQSIRGGIDVAHRALMPSLPLDPGRFTHRTALPANARPWLANTVTLLPGTLTARLDGDRLQIHAIQRSADVEAGVLQAEARIAALIEDSSEGAER